ncbi:hypothetical protein ACJ73_04693 [Blastomyces percursus]|uniref:Uncharacterized protein n=1 Tax=Blastomyces percursus TaxID=1658174 RepID=A0A1J9Q5Z7_9EURO|nr:hypothetical protein ACJ73_04693 [Blastomyces percursus]
MSGSNGQYLAIASDKIRHKFCWHTGCHGLMIWSMVFQQIDNNTPRGNSLYAQWESCRALRLAQSIDLICQPPIRTRYVRNTRYNVGRFTFESEWSPTAVPYNQTTTSPVIACRTLGKFLYETHLRSRQPQPRLSVAGPIRVVRISDTRNSTLEVPNGDLLVHADDLTQQGTFVQLQAQINWLASLPHRYKVVIAGNRALVLDPDFTRRFPYRLSPDHSKQSLLDSLDWMVIIYLQDRSVTLTFPHGRKLNVYGSPHTPEFGL